MSSAGNSQPNGAPAIHAEQLCRHYRMGETVIRAVDGVTLEVRAGEFVALLGSSGSGKSSVSESDCWPGPSYVRQRYCS